MKEIESGDVSVNVVVNIEVVEAVVEVDDTFVVVEVVVGLGVVMGIRTGVVEVVNWSDPVTKMGLRFVLLFVTGEEAEIEKILFVS